MCQQREGADPDQGHQRGSQRAWLRLHDPSAVGQASDEAGYPQCGRRSHHGPGAPGSREEPEPQGVLPEEEGGGEV